MAAHPGLYHVDLCAGSGMLGLAVKLALGGRIRTVAYVEREAYAAAALVARMADKALDSAPVWDDVRTLTSEEFLGYVRRFHPLLVTAGYPCQPFSVAGKRLGVNDDRHLWPWIDAFIGAAKPQCVFLENVPGHLRMGFADVRRDLQRRGYRVAAGLFSAEEVGASHRRERLFILALRLADAANGGCRAMRQTSERRGQSDRRDCPLAHAEDTDGRPRVEGVQGRAGLGWDGLADDSAVVGHASSGKGDGRESRTLEPAAGQGPCVDAVAGDAGGVLAHADGGNRDTLSAGRDPAPADRVPLAHAERASIGPKQLHHAGEWSGCGAYNESMPGERGTAVLNADGPGLFAPGPADRDAWRSVLARDPSLEPAIRRVADGLAPGVVGDRLRLTGNGVVPLAAGYAFVSLCAALLDA